MTSKLFDFQTTVDAHIENSQIKVTITAPKVTRSKIWNLVTNGQFNPGVAYYDGQTPTTITLTPYPGCTASLLVNLAYAAACFAQVDDFTSLLDDDFCVIDLLSPCPKAINFQPDLDTIMEFQAVVGGYLAIKDLQRRVDELGGINYQAIMVWYDEAVEAFRRLQFADTYGKEKAHQNQLDIATANIYRIERIESRARTMREAQADAKRQLKAAIADFATTIETQGLTEQARNTYHQISAYLKSEQVRLDTEVDEFTQDWDTLRISMDALRKVTPPAPPAKK